MKWPAERIEFRRLEALKPYEANPRVHSPEQIAQIARSIGEFGFTMPVLVDESGEIIAGHGRVLAAKTMGLAEVPTVNAVGWTEAQRRAYRIADNQLTLLGGWDDELLQSEMLQLQGADFDLALTGFDDAGLAGLLDRLPEGATDPDEAPQAPQVAASRLGDCWLLGRHRLVCGDACADVAVVAALDGVRPNLMVADPPYGVDYDADWRNRADRANGKPYGALAIGQVANDDQSDWSTAWALFPGDVVYCWHAGRHASTVQASLEASGFEIVSQIIWAKTRLIISRGDYHWQHEPCWYAVRKGKKHGWHGDRSQTTLWTIDHQKSETGHSAQKPVECMRRPIENNSSPGQAVYDPFVGSGTTIIAAEMTGRACHAIELNPVYVDVSVLRWQNFTEKKATLDGDGRTFDEIAAVRLKEAA
jgi:DNA modification methylase